jgi:CRP-like cAMP-binding protein
MNVTEMQNDSMYSAGAGLLWKRQAHVRTLARWKHLVGRTSVVQRCEPETVLLSGCNSTGKSFVVEEGVIALAHHLSNGKQVFLTLRAAGQIFGHSYHVLNHSFELSASALTRCVIRVIDSEWLVEQIKQGGEVGVLLMEQHAFDLYRSGTDLINLIHLDASARLERFLAQFAIASGVSPGEEVCVNVPLTDGYLARLLGISAQQFSTIKRRLSIQGKVRHVRETRNWVLSPGKAQEMSMNS